MGVIATLALVLVPIAYPQASPSIPAQEEQQEEIVQLSPFQVSGKGDRGYGVTNSVGASRINLPLEDITTSVTTLNRQFQDDIGAGNLIDAIKYVSGVDKAPPLSEQWSIRGTGTDLTMLDGVPDPAGKLQRYDPLLTERIEVLKGPVGTLYGAHSAGGLVNRVSKYPLSETRNELAVWAGSWKMMRVDGDFTGPLGGDKKLLYRLIASFRDGEYNYLRSTYDKQMISPSLSYMLSARSKVWARFIYHFEQRPNAGNQNYFLDAGNNVSYFVPRSSTLDNPDATFYTRFRGYEAGYDNVFSTGRVEWAFRALARLGNARANYILYTKPQYRFLDASGAVLGTQANMLFSDPRWVSIAFDRRRRERYFDQESHVYNADLSAKFTTGPVEQMALTYFQGGSVDEATEETIANYAPSNVQRPVYFENGTDGITGPATINTSTVTTNDWYAWGMQHNLFFLKKRVILAGGARFDHQETDALNRQNNARTPAVNEQWSYKLGLIGKPRAGVALFYNWSQTFTPENRIDPVTGDTFPNQTSLINEGGVKVDLFDSRVTGTFSVYDILQEKVVVNVHDPLTGNQRLQALGNRVIRGWEADFDSQPIDNLSLKVSIGSIDKAATETGARPRWVSIGFTYRGFAKYTFRHGFLKGLSVGGGVVTTTDSAGDNTDTFTLPGYVLYDGMAQYSRGKWSLQVNVTNLTDKVYAITSVDRTRVYSGEPRNIQASYRIRF